MANTPARRTKTPAKKDAPIFEVVATNEDAEEYTARLFGEETFTFSTDVNAFRLVEAGTGSSKSILTLLWSLIVVEPVEGEDIEETREKEKERFGDFMRSRKHLDVEALMELINDITEAGGKDR